MDMLIFSGQSNMQGQTESLPQDEEHSRCKEYKYSSDSVVSLKNPVGEDIGDLLLGSHLGHGSLLPYFCEAYSDIADRDVIAVHTAKGATTVRQWLKGTAEGNDRYKALINKVRSAEAKTGKAERKYFIWLQGESDALIKTGSTDYKIMLSKLKNDLIADLQIDAFMIIGVGYFAMNFGDAPADEVIMKAQKEICREDRDFIYLTDIAEGLSADKKNINPDAAGHFNNASMKVLGSEAGRNAAIFRNRNVTSNSRR